MSTKRLRLILSLSLSFASVLHLPARAFAQELVANESLDEWFFSRLLWGALIGVIAGVVVGLGDLCRLKFEINGSLNINNHARRKLLFWIAIIFILGAIILFVDAWLLYPFGILSLTFSDATQVWLNYRMLLVLLATITVFILVVAISTRFKSGCRCRYAFIPGPKGK
jgi:H+/Cl- antiporter ClcA